MIIEAYPTNVLPLPIVGGYVIKPGNNILRTQMERGAARHRKKGTTTPTKFSVSWLFSAYEFAVFEAWYEFKADEGAAWVSIPLISGLGIVTHEARFTRQYEAPLKEGNWWLVKSELETRQRPTLNEEALDVFMIEDAAGLLASINNFGTLVNSTLPQNPWYPLL